MTGVVWSWTPSTFALVATDSKRLALTTARPKRSAGTPRRAAVAHRADQGDGAFLERNLHDDAEVIKVVLRRTRSVQDGAGDRFTAARRGPVPPYKEILPKKGNARIPLDVTPS